jgi:hypothetical protein
MINMRRLLSEAEVNKLQSFKYKVTIRRSQSEAEVNCVVLISYIKFWESII